MFNKLVNLWQHVTTPQEADQDAARREYAARVILATLSITAVFAALIFMIAWLAGAVIYVFPLVSLVICLLLSGGLWLTHLGYWRLTGYIPALVIFLLAVYGNYLYGIATNAVMFYLLAVLLIGITENKWMQWVGLFLCLAVYVGLGIAHLQYPLGGVPMGPDLLVRWTLNMFLAMIIALELQRFLNNQLHKTLQRTQEYAAQLAQESEERRHVENERTQLLAEQATLQQQIIEAQQHALKELSTPIIPVMDNVIVMPLIGSIDSLRARDITRTLLTGITQHRAKVVILDVTGVSLMDTGIVNHLNKTIQAARLKGAQTIVTGMSDAVAEAIVDLGIDWSGVTTLSDLQTGLLAALDSLGFRLNKGIGRQSLSPNANGMLREG
ncbi:MAG: STAS domain-containing protein [Anaerolineae bacterium]|nr:STAS domain-containing protein [Anaerolineae bacterium]